MNLDGFWEAIDAQLEALTTADTVDDIVRICPVITDITAPDASGFFAGSGGDGSVEAALETAGWRHVWREAHYHWCMFKGTEYVTYVEGDLYRGNQLPLPHGGSA